MVHDNLTVVAVYGHHNGASAIPALQRSVQELPGSRGLLLSIARPPMLPDNIEHRCIFPLDYHQYSWFMMYSLWNFIQTEYLLVVQDDGWVLNGSNLTEEHYQYDYIGSITHCALTADKYDYYWSWRELEEPRMVVQNGGFSFRSKRFLKAPSQFGIMHTTFNVEPFCNEDVQLTSFLRPHLESVGMKYAPESVASQFSIEYLAPNYHDGLNMDKLVGIHGQTRKLIGLNQVLVIIKDQEIEEQFGETQVLSYLESKGYGIHYHRLPATEQERTEEADQAVC